MLLLAGVVLATVNFVFLWTQLPSQQCTCDCSSTPSRNLHDGVRTDATTSSLARTNSASKGIQSELHGQQNPTETVVTLVTTSEDGDTPLSPLKVAEPYKPIQGDEGYGSHRLAVVVPFRNRFEELLEFAPHIHQFLERQKIGHQIWIINQADSHR